MESIKMENNLQQASFGDLPLHVIKNILDSLQMCDLISARVTCRQWLITTENSKLWKRIMFSNKCENLINLPIDQHLTTSKMYENMSLSFVHEINNDHFLFFQQFGIYVKFLNMSIFKMDNSFLKVLTFLPSLVNLELSCITSNNLFNIDLNDVPVCLKNFKSLSLTIFKTDKEILSSITRVIPKLEKFSIKKYSNSLISDLRILDCFYFLTYYRQTLKSLEMSSYYFDNLFKNGPVEIEELNLKELRIDTHPRYVSTAIEFVLTQTNLTYLDLTNMHLTPTQIKLICKSLNKLETLRYNGRFIPRESIKNLKNLKALYITEFFGAEIIERDAISESPNVMLQVLHLNYFDINQTFSSLFMNLPNLRELSIKFRRIEVDVFQLIFKYLTNLESLDISYYSRKNELNISNDTQDLLDLGRLNKLKSLKFNFPAEKIPGFSLKHLMKLKNLKTLQIHQLKPAISIADQIKLMQSLTLLSEVDFNHWNGIDPNVILQNGVRLSDSCNYSLRYYFQPGPARRGKSEWVVISKTLSMRLLLVLTYVLLKV